MSCSTSRPSSLLQIISHFPSISNCLQHKCADIVLINVLPFNRDGAMEQESLFVNSSGPFDPPSTCIHDVQHLWVYGGSNLWLMLPSFYIWRRGLPWTAEKNLYVLKICSLCLKNMLEYTYTQGVFSQYKQLSAVRPPNGTPNPKLHCFLVRWPQTWEMEQQERTNWLLHFSTWASRSLQG